MDENIFDAKNVPESSWFAFKKVGDKVSGVVGEIFEKVGQGEFPDQKVFVLKQKDGTEVNVGIKKSNLYIIQRTNKVRAGDVLGFEFTAEIPAKVKGHNPAKSITPYVKYTEEGNRQREIEQFDQGK